mgnify:CR=1 FL=1
MSLEQLILLALIQGITEFLPISSSGHLNLLHLLTSMPDEGVMVDVAVHVGTLMAVLVYFRTEVMRLAVGFFKMLRGKVTPDGRFALYLILATLPVMAVGIVLLKTGLVTALRTVEVVAWANLIFAVVLYGADRTGLTVRRMEHLTAPGALAIGIAQVLSLIPGASRAGVTITMARLLGYERPDAARISMLLSIPTIIAAAAATSYDAYESGNVALQMDMAVAALLAFGAAIITIALFMRLLTRTTLLPFVLYRLVLGAALLAWVYS